VESGTHKSVNVCMDLRYALLRLQPTHYKASNYLLHFPYTLHSPVLCFCFLPVHVYKVVIAHCSCRISLQYSPCILPANACVSSGSVPKVFEVTEVSTSRSVHGLLT
jgi:hypothetical protein